MDFLLLIAGLIGLWLGTELTIGGALAIARRHNLSEFFVGLHRYRVPAMFIASLVDSLASGGRPQAPARVRQPDPAREAGTEGGVRGWPDGRRTLAVGSSATAAAWACPFAGDRRRGRRGSPVRPDCRERLAWGHSGATRVWIW